MFSPVKSYATPLYIILRGKCAIIINRKYATIEKKSTRRLLEQTVPAYDRSGNIIGVEDMETSSSEGKLVVFKDYSEIKV